MDGNTAAHSGGGSGTVTADINYTSQAAEKPEYFAAAAGGDERDQTARVIRHAFSIRDARAESQRPSLDREGFELVPVDDMDRDFFDAPSVRAEFYPQIEALVRRSVGAKRVHAFDHNIRNRSLAEAHEGGAQKPVKFAHNDYTERSGPQRLKDLFPDEADALSARRFSIVNVWMPFSVPAVDTPLAICDARSIGSGELLPSDLRYEDRVGEIYSLAYSAEHVWWYYSAMQPGEAMLLKCYDSENDGRARFTAHAAFSHPDAGEDAPERRSIEVRTMAFF